MDTPRSKPNFFYRTLFAGALFSLARTDIFPTMNSQVSFVPSVGTNSSAPIIGTVTGASNSSNLAPSLDIIPPQPSNANSSSPAPLPPNSAATPKNNDGRQPNKSSNNDPTSQKPQAERNPPNFQGHFEWQRRDKAQENGKPDASKISPDQNRTSAWANRTVFEHPRLNQTRFNISAQNQTEGFSRSNHILGNETAQHTSGEGNRLPQANYRPDHNTSDRQGKFTSNSSNYGKNLKGKTDQQSETDANQQIERGHGHQTLSTERNYQHSYGERGTSGIYPQSRGGRRWLQENDGDDGDDGQRQDNRDQFDERDHQARGKRRFNDERENDRFDDEEDEGGHQLRRRRPRRCDRERNDDWEEDDEERRREDDDDWEEDDEEQWSEEESDYRPRRHNRPSRRHYDDEEDDGDYQKHAYRAPHHRSSRTSRNYGYQSTQHRRSSHRRTRGDQRNPHRQQQRPSSRRYN